MSPKKKTLKLGIPRFAYHKKTTFSPCKQTRGTHEKGRRRHEKRKEKSCLSSFLSFYMREVVSQTREMYIPPEREREREEGRDHFSRVPNPTHPPLPYYTLLLSHCCCWSYDEEKKRERRDHISGGEKRGNVIWRILNKKIFL